jgi:hypothetical protein
MKVIYNGTHDKVITCTEFINDLFNTDILYNSIIKKDSFTHTEYKPKDIASIMKKDDTEIQIKLYKSKNPFTNSNAYVNRKYPNTLFLNTRKLWRDKKEIVNTIVHECVHVIDYSENGKIDFGHGDNYPNGKEDSAPYWIGNEAKIEYLESLNSEIEIEAHVIDESCIINE